MKITLKEVKWNIEKYYFIQHKRQFDCYDIYKFFLIKLNEKQKEKIKVWLINRAKKDFEIKTFSNNYNNFNEFFNNRIENDIYKYL